MSVRSVPAAAFRPLLVLVILGGGVWTLRAADPPGEKALFEENFTDAPGESWSWLREVRDHWKIDKDRKELLIRPGWAVDGMKNMLIRAVPDGTDGPVAVEVHVNHVPVADYEVSGLTLYFDDSNFVNIQRELMGDNKTGKVELFLWGRKAGEKLKSPKRVTYKDPDIDLRMVLTGTKVEGWYRASSTEQWQSLGELESPGNGGAKIGLRTNNGVEDKPSWVRFSKFRILQLGS